VTTKDKTGDQLMASIRKTKTQESTPDKGAAATPQAAPTVAKTTAPKAKPAAAKSKPAAPRRPATTKKKVAAKPKAARAATEQPTAYQASRRVWPD
jgi:hypothetical protein